MNVSAKLLGWITLAVAYGCGGTGNGGGTTTPPDTHVLFSAGATIAATGGTVADPVRGISIIVPAGGVAVGARVSLEVLDAQRSGLARGFGANVNAINVDLDPNAMTDGALIQVRIPISSDFDAIRTFGLAVDLSGTKTVPLPTAYDSTNHAIVATIGKPEVALVAGPRGRASGHWFGLLAVTASNPSTSASGSFSIYRQQGSAIGAFAALEAGHVPTNKRVAVIVPDVLGVSRDAAGLARFLQNDVDDYANTDVYNEVWYYDYARGASLQETARRFANDLLARIDSTTTIDLYGHGAGGLVCRWALEKEGLGARVTDFISLQTPHAGLPVGVAQLLAYRAASISGGLEGIPSGIADLAEVGEGSFLDSLNSGESLYRGSAHYIATSGTVYQGYIGAFGEIANLLYSEPNDGLVSQSSAFSDILSQRSAGYAQDPSGRRTMWDLRHNEALGDPNESGGGCAPNRTDSLQCLVESRLKDLILANLTGVVRGGAR